MTALIRRMGCTIEDSRGMHAHTVVAWHYATTDPYAVLLVIPGAPRWRFARDLLVDGLSRPAGEGDVLVRPLRSCVEVTLRSPSGQAVLTLNRPLLSEWVETTTRMVPRGREDEHVDPDAVLRALGVVS